MFIIIDIELIDFGSRLFQEQKKAGCSLCRRNVEQNPDSLTKQRAAFSEKMDFGSFRAFRGF
jgi:hypothetical protein